MFSLPIFTKNFFGSNVNPGEKENTTKNATKEVTKNKAEKIAFKRIKEAEENMDKIEKEVSRNSKDYHHVIDSEMKKFTKRLDTIKKYDIVSFDLLNSLPM